MFKNQSEGGESSWFPGLDADDSSSVRRVAIGRSKRC